MAKEGRNFERLEVGRQYRSRGGPILTVEREFPRSTFSYAFQVSLGEGVSSPFAGNGDYWHHGTPSPNDAMELLPLTDGTSQETNATLAPDSRKKTILDLIRELA